MNSLFTVSLRNLLVPVLVVFLVLVDVVALFPLSSSLHK